LTVRCSARLKLTGNRVESVCIRGSSDALTEIVTDVDVVGKYTLGAGILVGSTLLTICSGTRLKLTCNRVESIRVGRSSDSFTEVVTNVKVVSNCALGAGILVGSTLLTVRCSARLKLTGNRVESVCISGSSYSFTEIVTNVDVVG
jgi:hypothetical protein